MTALTSQQILAQAEDAQRRGQNPQAIPLYRKVLAQDPSAADAWHGLGRALMALNQVDDAIDAYQRALALRPAEAKVHYNLGVALFTKGRIDDAILAYQQAVSHRPDFPIALANLATLLAMRGEYDQAIATFQRALRLAPTAAPMWLNLGNILKDLGDLDGALAHYDRAIALCPADPVFQANRVFCTIFHPGFDAATILAEARGWDQLHGQPLRSQILPHTNDRSPDRRLRIGYVSPDFRKHCQAHFTVPLLSHHDREHFEIVCYASVLHPDATTARLRGYCDIWREVRGADHQQLAQIIRDDAVDVLVDLTMHMAGNRLAVFARKPAPVQVAWLAYPGTTGLAAMDYRLTDPYLDPPETGDRLGDGLGDGAYSEQSIRLPNTFWCYDPLTTEPPVNALPAKASGQITFGCLNNFFKTSDGALDLWAKVLTAIPTSRLLLLAPPGSPRKRVLDRLGQAGVAAERIEFVARQERPRYLQTYHRIDIALDTIPYNGHTTSLDAFWMGVPVVTLIGQRIVGRAGFSQLCNLGLSDLAAQSPDQFVRIAVDLAKDLGRLAELRSTLRQRMIQSPLMDAPLFARNIEQAYRQMWQAWCQKTPPT